MKKDEFLIALEFLSEVNLKDFLPKKSRFPIKGRGNKRTKLSMETKTGFIKWFLHSYYDALPGPHKQTLIKAFPHNKNDVYAFDLIISKEAEILIEFLRKYQFKRCYNYRDMVTAYTSIHEL